MSTVPRIAWLTLALALWPACAAEPAADDDPRCDDGKCDLPGGSEEAVCQARRADAFDPNQIAFTPEFLRWSCDDVAGVTGEDRGQEYCEYFAIAQLPPVEASEPAPPPVILGKNVGPDAGFGTTETRLELGFEQLEALEAAPSAIAGQCVFTSWNNDVPGGEICPGGTCPSVLGVRVSELDFRMMFEVNSFDAALRLVRDCRRTVPRSGDSQDAEDPRHDDFMRGCLFNQDLNGTGFRKSDTFVCAAAMRFGECGCEITEPGLARLISGPKHRGFPLGTWSSPTALPVGCRYVDLGDGSQTIVACDLTSVEVIDYGLDLKGYCQSKYADNVVVHVAMPEADQVTCDPEASDSDYRDTCSERPWLLPEPQL